MPEIISDLFNIQNRYLRSVNLERDFLDPKAIKGYVLTPQAQNSLKRLSMGLAAKSGQRAWRITGNYGVGKSSFALVLAHLLAGNNSELPTNLRQAVNFNKLGVSRPQILPVLITGSRESLALALLRSLLRALLETCGRGRLPAVIDKIQAQVAQAVEKAISDSTVINLLAEASEHITTSGKGTGLLIIIDELGKFLEFAALNPDKQDIFLLQSLAENASRSGKTPLFIVGLLHQGFHAYADTLSEFAQKELEKVAGRFEEILFIQPLEQTSILVADAIKVRVNQLPKGIVSQAQRDMVATLKSGWYGAAAAESSLVEDAARLYPLHPTVLPVLVKLFSRFGQNERSLFSFLLSNEPFGLQDFATQSISNKSFYRIHNLYDYARATFGHRLSVQSYRSHWNQIDSLITSFAASDNLDLEILKTVGLLNMLDADNLLASDEAILLAVAGESSSQAKRIEDVIKRLQKGKRVLYYRGAAGGYCLWPHTSVNLERAYEDATKAIGTKHQRISSFINRYLETRPLVARRHYIETGNLRHFEVRFSPVIDLVKNLQFSHDSADGLILVALCETEEERQAALDFALSRELQNRPEVLLAIPKPLNALAQLVQETQRWEWILANTPELNGDRYAAEEVSRQIAASRQIMEKRIHAFIGLQQFTGKTELQWFRQNKVLIVNSGRELLSQLSAICYEIYPKAPRILNELVNRRTLSSAAAAARMRLIERIFTYPTKFLLGMDPDKKPPEMSIYLSLLKEGGIHNEKDNDSYALALPDEKHDPCRIRPALDRIQQFLEGRADSRVKVSEIFADLRRPPYGVRDGLSPLLLALFAVINEQHVAFYKNGSFMREMAGLNIMHLTKVPEAFEIQYCKIAGVRSDLYEKLLRVFELTPTRREKVDLLDVVRPLCVFAAQLPTYTHKTKRLSASALAVRNALLSGREPATLLFRQLPEACAFSPFSTEVDKDSKEVQMFVEALKRALDELKLSYQDLQDRIRKILVKEFDLAGELESIRPTLTYRADNILIAVNEPGLKAFCLRLIDTNLPEPEWLESLGSFICSMSPSKWADADEDKFEQELSLLCDRFRRVESIAFRTQKASANESAVRVTITQQDGSEVDNVIYVSKGEEKRVAEIEAEITSLLKRTSRVGLAATARAFWKALAKKNAGLLVEDSLSLRKRAKSR
jgi:hypothetical protein